MLHTHIVPSPVNPGKMAVQITHQRADGLFIIGYAESYDTSYDRWFAYTLDDYKLVCDPDDGEAMLFTTVEDAGAALTNADVFHLRPGAVKTIR